MGAHIHMYTKGTPAYNCVSRRPLPFFPALCVSFCAWPRIGTRGSESHGVGQRGGGLGAEGGGREGCAVRGRNLGPPLKRWLRICSKMAAKFTNSSDESSMGSAVYFSSRVFTENLGGAGE